MALFFSYTLADVEVKEKEEARKGEERRRAKWRGGEVEGKVPLSRVEGHLS